MVIFQLYEIKIETFSCSVIVTGKRWYFMMKILAWAAFCYVKRDFKDVDHSVHLLCFLITSIIGRRLFFLNGRWSDSSSSLRPKKDGREPTGSLPSCA